MTRLLMLLLPIALTACGESDTETEVNPATADEAQALNEAAEMLDGHVNNATETLPVVEAAANAANSQQ